MKKFFSALLVILAFSGQAPSALASFQPEESEESTRHTAARTRQVYQPRQTKAPSENIGTQLVKEFGQTWVELLRAVCGSKQR